MSDESRFEAFGADTLCSLLPAISRRDSNVVSRDLDRVPIRVLDIDRKRDAVVSRPVVNPEVAEAPLGGLEILTVDSKSDMVEGPRILRLRDPLMRCLRHKQGNACLARTHHRGDVAPFILE